MKHDPVIETNNTGLSVLWKLSFKFHPQLKKKKTLGSQMGTDRTLHVDILTCVPLLYLC
jgi:hypothetical protein